MVKSIAHSNLTCRPLSHAITLGATRYEALQMLVGSISDIPPQCGKTIGLGHANMIELSASPSSLKLVIVPFGQLNFTHEPQFRLHWTDLCRSSLAQFHLPKKAAIPTRKLSELANESCIYAYT